MTRKRPKEQDRGPIVGALARFGRGRYSQSPPSPQNGQTAYPVPPSRKNRKALTTWQDAVALKQLKDIANETGLSQQALIAEGLNYVLIKYRKPTVAT